MSPWAVVAVPHKTRDAWMNEWVLEERERMTSDYASIGADDGRESVGWMSHGYVPVLSIEYKYRST